MSWPALPTTSNKFKQTYFQGFVDISGGGLIVRNSDASFNANLSVGATLSVVSTQTRNISINKNTVPTSGYSLDVSGNVLINGNLSIPSNTSINFGSNAPIMSGANIVAGTIPASAIGGGLPYVDLTTSQTITGKKTFSSVTNFPVDIVGNSRVSGFSRFPTSNSNSGITFSDGTTCKSRIYHDSNLIMWSNNNIYIKGGGTSGETGAPSANTLVYIEGSTQRVAIGTETTSVGYALTVNGNVVAGSYNATLAIPTSDNSTTVATTAYVKSNLSSYLTTSDASSIYLKQSTFNESFTQSIDIQNQILDPLFNDYVTASANSYSKIATVGDIFATPWSTYNSQNTIIYQINGSPTLDNGMGPVNSNYPSGVTKSVGLYINGNGNFLELSAYQSVAVTPGSYTGILSVCRPNYSYTYAYTDTSELLTITLYNGANTYFQTQFNFNTFSDTGFTDISFNITINTTATMVLAFGYSTRTSSQHMVIITNIRFGIPYNKLSLSINGNIQANSYTATSTPATSDNSTTVATTAYVKSNLSGYVDLTTSQTITGTKTFSSVSNFPVDIVGNCRVSGFQRFPTSNSNSGITFSDGTTCKSRIYHDSNLIMWSNNNIYIQGGGTSGETGAPSANTLVYIEGSTQSVAIGTETTTAGYALTVNGNVNAGSYNATSGILTSDNSTRLATTAYVKSNLTSYAVLASPALTGTPSAPTPVSSDNSTTVATTAYVKSNLSSYAVLASPTLTGTPTAPTAASLINTTQIATTAYVKSYFVDLSTAQTVGGVKTFSSAPVMSGASITAGTIPTSALSGTFVDLSTAQTVVGVKTFSSAPVMSGASITAGTIPTGALNNGSGTFVDLSTAQTVGGVKTFTSTMTLSNGLTVSSGTVTLPGRSVADAALSANVPLINGTNIFTGTSNTFNNIVTLSGGLTVSSGTVTLPGRSVADGALSANVPLINGTNIFTGTSNTFNNIVTLIGGLTASATPQTINFGTNPPTMSGARITAGTIPTNALNNGSGTFVDLTTTQSIGGVKTFSNPISFGQSVTSGITFGGSPSTSNLTGGVSSKIYDDGNLHLWTDDHFFIDVIGTCAYNGTPTSGPLNKLYINQYGTYINCSPDKINGLAATGYEFNVNGSSCFTGGGGDIIRCVNYTNTAYFFITSSISIGVYQYGVSPIAVLWHIDSDGKYDGLTFASDRRLKENIEPLESQWNNILSINPVSFNWKESKRSDIGFIAQDIYAKYPSLIPPQFVSNNPNSTIEEPIDLSGNPIYYGMDYGKLTTFLWKGLQETMREIDSLKAENEQLKYLIHGLSQRISSLEYR
jgi:hypothetical protein